MLGGGARHFPSLGRASSCEVALVEGREDMGMRSLWCLWGRKLYTNDDGVEYVLGWQGFYDSVSNHGSYGDVVSSD